ncbi:MAG: hypothetical protein RLZZ505_2936 [Verrucomicrobiota bacterium]|jgi:hypothetical protein
MTWNDKFTALFERVADNYRKGDFDYEEGYTAEEIFFLEGIGCKKREFFDFVEDFVDEGEPSIGTALLIAAVRRDYFLFEQKGEVSGVAISRDELPSFGEDLHGISYLPRILVKARAKLRGELDPDIMYGCGGDRNFLAKNGGLHPADFLRKVWAASGDDSEIVTWITSSRGICPQTA